MLTFKKKMHKFACLSYDLFTVIKYLMHMRTEIIMVSYFIILGSKN